MKSRAAQLRDMAWECRTLAKTIGDEKARGQLLEVAEQFERLAERYEKNGKPTRPRIRC
jgi:hypothetical protein